MSAAMRALQVTGSRGKKLPSIVALDGHVDNRTSFYRRVEPHERIVLAPTQPRRFRQHTPRAADLGVEMRAQRRRTLLAQPPGALLHDLTDDLRHARGRRAGPRRERKDMQMGQAAV